MELYSDRAEKEVFSSLRNGTLPQSILFEGPRYSGRLSLALDLSYEIAGEREKRRTLEGIDILYFPSRDMGLEIRSEFNILKERFSLRQRNNFIRKVRLSLMQYHSALEDASAGKGKYFDKAGSISEMIYMLLDLDMEKDRKEILKLAEDITNSASDPLFAFKGKKKGGISVDEVRACSAFAQTGKEDKFIIIENIEDAMEASKNALLKILEEPPEGTHFILISENPQRIMQTIMSRVRRFTFSPPSKEKINECLREWYLEWNEYPSFESFIFEMSVPGEQREAVRDCSSRYFDYLMSGTVPDAVTMNEILAPLDSGRQFFISLLMDDMKKAFRLGEGSARMLYEKVRCIREAVQNAEVFNLNMKNALDLALREAGNVHQNS